MIRNEAEYKKAVEKLKQENLLQPNSCKTYAVGQLVLWSKSLSVTTQGLSLLTTPSVTNIAVANPQTAPYGAAAIETLTKANLLTAVQPKIVYAETVSQAFQFAQTGNADVGFTALSLVLGVSGGTYMVIPSKLHSPIEQAVGLVVKASPQAKEFEDFLFSKEGRKMFAADGYLPPPRPH